MKVQKKYELVSFVNKGKTSSWMIMTNIQAIGTIISCFFGQQKFRRRLFFGHKLLISAKYDTSKEREAVKEKK